MDYPLSEQGHQQSKALKKKFEADKFTPNLVYSSPLKRAMCTARIALPGRKIVTIDDLKEEDIGVFSGKTYEEVRRDYSEAAEKFRRTGDIDVIPRSESRRSLAKRAKTVVNFLVKSHNNEDNIVVFTHGGIMIPLIGTLLQTREIWRINIPNTAVFQFVVDVDWWGQPRAGRKNHLDLAISQFAYVGHLG